jgi:hydrogenase small subunit
MYERLPDMPVGPATSVTADQIGIVLGAATAVGIAGHLAGNVLTGRIGPKKADKSKEGEA